MPTIGEGLGQAGENFFRMRILKKQKQEQDKLKSVQPIITAINARLADETVSFDERKELLNQLQNVYENAGIKVKLPKGQTLADIILPSHILDQIQQIGETVNDTAVNAVPEGQSQTENITTSPVQINLTKRRGEMSPAEIQLALHRMANKGQMSDELAKQEEYARFQVKLNDEIASKQYTRNPEEVVEPKTGRVWSVYTSPNSKFPVIFQPLGLYKTDRGELVTAPEESTIPLSTYNAREKAKGGGASATMKNLIFTAARELQLPEADERVLNLAGQRYEEQWHARTENLQYSAKGGEQKTGGKQPIQPTDQARLDFERQRYLDELEGQISKQTVIFNGAKTRIGEIDSLISKLKAEIATMTGTGPEGGFVSTDKEVKAIKDDITELEKEKRVVESTRDLASAEQTRVQTKLDSYSKKETPNAPTKKNTNSNSDTTGGADAGSTVGSALGGYTNQEKLAIAGFREKNKNHPVFGKWTDEQILEWARQKGYLPPKKMN